MDPSSLPRLNCRQSKWDILDNILGDCYRKRLSLGMPAEMPYVSLDSYEDQLADAKEQQSAVEEFAQERSIAKRPLNEATLHNRAHPSL
jgi:hypothetical protein